MRELPGGRILAAMRPEGLPSATFTWKDFVALDEDDPRELIDGVLLEVDVPTRLHEHIVAMLTYFMVGWSRRHGGQVLVSGYRIRVSARRGVMPDLQYFGPARARHLPESGLAKGRPDLAVEVISPRSRRHDRVTKRAWYASIGVPEYWIVDPEARTLDRLVLAGAEFRLATTARESATFAPPSFTGLAIPLAELWKAPPTR